MTKRKTITHDGEVYSVPIRYPDDPERQALYDMSYIMAMMYLLSLTPEEREMILYAHEPELYLKARRN